MYVAFLFALDQAKVRIVSVDSIEKLGWGFIIWSKDPGGIDAQERRHMARVD